MGQAQRQRGFIGNSMFVPQAAPSKIQKVLPPAAEEVQSNISYVLVDSKKHDLHRAAMLPAPRAEYEAAVESLQTTSLFYAQVVLDPVNGGASLQTRPGAAGVTFQTYMNNTDIHISGNPQQPSTNSCAPNNRSLSKGPQGRLFSATIFNLSVFGFLLCYH